MMDGPWSVRIWAGVLMVVAVAFTVGRMSHSVKLPLVGGSTWSFRGYHLGDDWEDVGRDLSCSVDSLYGIWEKACVAGNGLDLYFAEDNALEYMIYEVPLPGVLDNEVDPRQIWLDVRGLIRPIVGEADSVTDASGDWIGDRLYAFWVNHNGRCAKLEVMGRPHLGGWARVVLTVSKCD